MKKLWVLCLVLSLNIGIASAKTASPGYSVLAYHDVFEEKLQPTVGGKLTSQAIGLRKLITHFDWLKLNGYQPVSFQAIVDAAAGKKPLPEKAVLLTFDDGYKSFYNNVYPLLKLYQYPAVLAVVGKWVDTPEGQEVDYGGQAAPRSMFLSWAQIKELSDSGLVEIASHSYDLHHGELASPTGYLQPAALTAKVYDLRRGELTGPVYLQPAALTAKITNSTYETPAQFIQRVHLDLTQSVQQLKQKTGIAPRIMVWPYGAFSDTSAQIATDLGMKYQMSLNDTLGQMDVNNVRIGRFLIDEASQVDTIQDFLNQKMWSLPTQRVIHVDLDYVYDANLSQMQKNIDALLEQIKTFGVSTVYLQAFADANGDGVAEALYFHNRHMPVKADLFNLVGWQLMRRTNVQVYAWMPVMGFDLGAKYDYLADPHNTKRLNPYIAQNRQVIKEIYEDLGVYTKFNGILFHDDAFLTDDEGEGNTSQKTQFLIDLTHELKNTAAQFQSGGVANIKTARNLYAIVILDDSAPDRFAQNLEAFTQAYDYTAVMAMPYMEGAEHPEQWLATLAKNVGRRVDTNKVVFELQTVDWRNAKPVASKELVSWMSILQNNGITNIGYYPDDFLKNHPDATQLHPVFSLSNKGVLKQ